MYLNLFVQLFIIFNLHKHKRNEAMSHFYNKKMVFLKTFIHIVLRN